MPRVVFANVGLEVEVEADASILEAAQAVGAPQGSHCGGVCACSTCHVYIVDGADLVSPQDAEEREVLELAARDLRHTSRLGCQVRVLAGTVTVEIAEESFQEFLDSNPDQRDRALELWLSKRRC